MTAMALGPNPAHKLNILSVFKLWDYHMTWESMQLVCRVKELPSMRAFFIAGEELAGGAAEAEPANG